MRPPEVTLFPDTVLVVDDEPVVTQVLARVLRLRGLSVETAANATEAEEHLRQKNFGCLLTDKNLPGSDGLELIALTRKVQPHCACIMITGYSSTASAIEALRLGAVDYLEKPFQDLELVAQKVKLAIEHHRATFEKQRLVRLLSIFQEELKAKEQVLAKQRNDIEIFNEILELRVDEATRDLRRKCQELETKAAASAQDGGMVGARVALGILEDIQAQSGMNQDALRGQLQRVVRQLRQHLQSSSPPPESQ
jgi:YesN/AraC family two-component response regulator